MAGFLDYGLLWYDADPQAPLTSKVERAVARYEQKFGRRPNACYVHRSNAPQDLDWKGVRVVGAPNVLPHHFWVGVVKSR